jgi:CRISPR-associated exonuclease Cas4
MTGVRNDEDYIPIAALNQYNYCPHRCWRMFCAGEFVENQYTIEGTSLHDRVHTVGEGNREETYQVRAIWLRSVRYGLIGKSDLIEEVDGRIYPVEYKRSSKGEFDNDAFDEGYVYYAQSHQRVLVEISADLRQEAVDTIAAVKILLETGKMPRPEYGPRCQGCSLYDACLPKAAAKLKRYQED